MVFEFDIATNSKIGFSPMRLTLHSRTSSNPSSGSGSQRNLINIAADGAVTSAFSSAKDTKNTYLSTQEWNHITIVVDTAVSKGRVYVYVNGDLIGSGEAYSSESAYLAGPRFDITASSTADFSFLIDNLLVRSFGDGSSTNAMKNPESYLMYGGVAWNKGIVNNNYTHTLEAGRMAVTDFSEITPNSDLILHLNRKYNTSFPVATNVRLATDGNDFNIVNGSTAFDTVYSAAGEIIGYDFNSKYASAKVTLKWFIGNVNNPKNLADESLWVSYESNSGIIPSSLYNTENATPKLISKGYTYTFAPVNGWNFAVGNQYDYTFAKNNPTVEIMPAFNEAEPTDMNYTYAVLDEDGCFSRGGTTTSLFGSGWYKNDNGTITGVQLVYGETFVFLSDKLVIKGNFQTGARGTESESKTFSFDFNGHKITFKSSENTTGKKGNYFTAKEGETFNFYSSLPGAEVKLAGLNGDTSTDASAGYFFTVTGQNYTYVDEDGKTQEDHAAILENINKTETDNIKAYIGTVTAFGTTYPGSNLAIYGDNLVRLANVWFRGEAGDYITDIMAEHILNSGVFGTTADMASSRAYRETVDTPLLVLRAKKMLNAIFPTPSNLKLKYKKLEKYPYLYPFYLIYRYFDALFNRKDNIKINMKHIGVSKDEIKTDLIENSRIFHFGSLSLTSECAEEATAYALETARKAGCIITCDPNYRASLWESESSAIDKILKYIGYANIIKVSKEEAEMLSGKDTLEECFDFFFSLGIKLVLITDGAEGAYFASKEFSGHAPSIKVQAVDTTGAGDIFFGSFISKFIKSEKELDELSYDDVLSFVSFAARNAGESTLKKGGLPSIPNINQ
jgi:hypothetical protein